MKKIPINGPAKYLTAGSLFAVIGTPLFIRALYNAFHGDSGFLTFATGMIILAIILIVFWRINVKTGKDPLNARLPLWVGYMFTWSGAGFLHLLLAADMDKSELMKEILVSSLFIIMGLPLLYVGIKNIFKPGKEDIKIINVVVAFAVIVGLLPVVLIIIAAYYAGHYIAATIILALMLFAIWGFKKLRGKKKTIK